MGKLTFVWGVGVWVWVSVVNGGWSRIEPESGTSLTDTHRGVIVPKILGLKIEHC